MSCIRVVSRILTRKKRCFSLYPPGLAVFHLCEWEPRHCQWISSSFWLPTLWHILAKLDISHSRQGGRNRSEQSFAHISIRDRVRSDKSVAEIFRNGSTWKKLKYLLNTILFSILPLFPSCVGNWSPRGNYLILVSRSEHSLRRSSWPATTEPHHWHNTMAGSGALKRSLIGCNFCSFLVMRCFHSLH